VSVNAKPAILRSLGIVGWDHLEPVILAALATESPLLLIGPHGSAKTLVLTRLAESLGLVQRHYNASLLNFDDLIGFPVPEGGKLVYLQTPATIWEAESVFFDEVSRCRPDLQNKLFPIVHERRVQGVALERLRHRWAAMNPPPKTDGRDDDGFEYAGAEPLDVALADRFAFVLNVPDLKALNQRDQASLFAEADEIDTKTVGTTLAMLLATVRADLPVVRSALQASIGEYVPLVAQKLAQARHPMSTRRAVQLARNIEALAAVFRARGDEAAPEDAFYVALRHSTPDAAWGSPVDPATVLTVHRSAWEIARLEHAALKEIFREADAVRRIALALAADFMSPAERGQVVMDSYASLDRPARLASVAVLLPQLSEDRGLPATAIEAIAADYAAIASSGAVTVTVRRGGADWKRGILGQWLSSLDLRTRRGKVLGNVAATLLSDEHEFTADQIERAFDHAVAVFHASADDVPSLRPGTRRQKVAS
jgi:MoxR-like ATPase